MARFFGSESTSLNSTEHVRDDLKSLKEAGSALGQHLKEDGRDLAASAMAGAQKKMKDLQSLSEKYVERATAYVKEKPAQSVGIAFMAGVVLSLLLKR